MSRLDPRRSLFGIVQKEFSCFPAWCAHFLGAEKERINNVKVSFRTKQLFSGLYVRWIIPGPVTPADTSGSPLCKRDPGSAFPGLKSKSRAFCDGCTWPSCFQLKTNELLRWNLGKGAVKGKHTRMPWLIASLNDNGCFIVFIRIVVFLIYKKGLDVVVINREALCWSCWL